VSAGDLLHAAADNSTNVKGFSQVSSTQQFFPPAGVAQAKVGIPFQDSMRKSGSSSEASMGGYGMEGKCPPAAAELVSQAQYV